MVEDSWKSQKKTDEKQLKVFRYSIFVTRIYKLKGAEAVILRDKETKLYKLIGIKRSSIKTDYSTTQRDPNAPPPPKTSSISDLDEKDVKILTDFFKDLEDKGLPTSGEADITKLVELLKKMDDKQKEDFAELYNSIEVPEGVKADEELEKIIESFLKLTELEREILKANLEEQKEEGTKNNDGLPESGKIRLKQIQKHAQEDTRNFKTVNEGLENIWKKSQHSSHPWAKEFKPLDEKGFFSLQNEIAILNGLLEGAGKKSTEIKKLLPI